jgi:endonuclease YncB( thermonuclease family)
MSSWASVIFLLLLLALWLYSEGLGLRPSRLTRSADGAEIVVRDGDTLTIEKQDYRLYDIDAPELMQLCKTAAGADWPCGKQARTELVARVARHTLTCEQRAHDKYGRIVATCFDETGLDVAKMMIERGMAVSFGGFSEAPYAFEEAQAKAAQRGLWQGRFDPPSSWRATHAHGPVANR